MIEDMWPGIDPGEGEVPLDLADPRAVDMLHSVRTFFDDIGKDISDCIITLQHGSYLILRAYILPDDVDKSKRRYVCWEDQRGEYHQRIIVK